MFSDRGGQEYPFLCCLRENTASPSIATRSTRNRILRLVSQVAFLDRGENKLCNHRFSRPEYRFFRSSPTAARLFIPCSIILPTQIARILPQIANRTICCCFPRVA